MMNIIQAEKELDKIASLPHRQPAILIESVKEGVKSMLYTSDFYAEDVITVFTTFCETGVLDFTGTKKVSAILGSN